MKNRKLFLLPVILLALSACTSRSSKPSESKPGESTPPVSESSETPTSVEPGESTEPSTPSEPSQPEEPSQPVEPSQPEEPSEPARDPLAAPVLRLNAEKTGLTWDAVADAVSYDIVVNDGDAQNVQTPGYTFNSEVGTYAVKVKARADVATYDSAFSTVFNYETKLTALGALTFDGEGNQIKMASLVGNGVEMKVDTGEFADATVNNLGIAITSGGLYTLHAKAGYDEDNNINYVANPNQNLAQKAILITLPAAEAKLIFNGSEENYDGWAKEYYGNSGWTTSGTANMESSDTGSDVTGSKTVKFTYHTNNNAFRLRNSSVAFAGAYDTISLDVKGDGIATVTLRLVIGGELFHNVYADFKIGVLPDTWVHIDVPMADETAWKINLGGTNYKFSDAAAAIELPYDETENPLGKNTKLNSLGQLMPLFTEVDVIIKNESTLQGSFKNYIYIDNLEFNNSHKNNMQLLEKPVLRDSYEWASDLKTGKIYKSGDDRFLKIDGVDTPIPVTIEVSSETKGLITVTSTTAPFEFVLMAASIDGGATFEAIQIQADENVKAAMANLRASAGQLIDAFTYNAQGEGYDQAHAIDAVEPGLRTAYFADFKLAQSDNAKKSPLDPTNWSLMGSTDYLKLNKEAGKSGKGCAELKVNGSYWMRYTTAGNVNGTATAYAKGTIFSIWIKNPNADKVASAKLRLFTKSNVAGNIDSGTLALDITIAGNQDWKEYKVALDPSKTYYGFSLALQNTAALNGKYILVDDVCVYSGGLNISQLLGK